MKESITNSNIIGGGELAELPAFDIGLPELIVDTPELPVMEDITLPELPALSGLPDLHLPDMPSLQ